MSPRQLKTAHEAYRDDIGSLVTRRPLPGPRLEQVSPFLFLNHHGPQTYPPDNGGLPFGPHPHRGFETVTFILEGELAHHDTGGHESVIGEGGVQWMTAGSGLVHAEISPKSFLERGGPLEILQLWVNLPSRLKFSPPNYVGLQRDDIPVVRVAEGVSAQLISGELAGVRGPIESLTGVMLSVVDLDAGAKASLPAPAGRNVFFYVVSGELRLGEAPVAKWRLAELTDGDSVEVEAVTEARLLFGHAEPIEEPVFSHGPFVMTSREEIIAAIEDYNAGKFGSLTL